MIKPLYLRDQFRLPPCMSPRQIKKQRMGFVNDYFGEPKLTKDSIFMILMTHRYDSHEMTHGLRVYVMIGERVKLIGISNSKPFQASGMKCAALLLARVPFLSMERKLAKTSFQNVKNTFE